MTFAKNSSGKNFHVSPEGVRIRDESNKDLSKDTKNHSDSKAAWAKLLSELSIFSTKAY